MQLTRVYRAVGVGILVMLATTVPNVMAESSEHNIDGRYLKAFTVAFADHVKIPDLTARQRQIEGYNIEFSEDPTSIYVLFKPKLTPGWRTFGGDTPNGRSARYTVEKKTYTITNRIFFK